MTDPEAVAVPERLLGSLQQTPEVRTLAAALASTQPGSLHHDSKPRLGGERAYRSSCLKSAFNLTDKGT